MIAYKGFSKKLTATMGKGIFQYEAGKTFKEDRSKTVSSGFHCCENIIECFSYYPPDGNSRYFMVEAAGDIDEDAYNRIACTEITLCREISYGEMIFPAMIYIINHPAREYENCGNNYKVTKDSCDAGHNLFTIVRGRNPRIRGKKDAIAGLIIESEDPNIIQDARSFIIGRNGIEADTWYTIIDGKVVKCDDQT